MYTFFIILLTPFLRFEYYFGAWIEFLGFFLKGQTWNRRLSCRSGSWPYPPREFERLAVFAAFHGPEVSLSNLGYVNSLKEAGFQVIYINNGLISSNSVGKLRPLCLAVLQRVNLGQDFGSYKDAYLCLRNFGWLRSVKWLLFCNDSMHFLGGNAGASFSLLLDQSLSSIEEPVIALNSNIQSWKHVQSFFVAVRSDVFNMSQFHKFWKNYLPLSHRYHSINNGEIRLSLRILNNFPSRILYTPSDLVKFALKALASKNSPGFSRLLLPKCCHEIVDGICVLSSIQEPDIHNPGSDFMVSDLTFNGIIFWEQLIILMGILEGTNVSHSCALMFSAFLGSPFIKKDICRHNVYNIVQVRQFLDYFFRINIGASSILLNEIISSFDAQGAHVSYRLRLRLAFRKGLLNRGFGIPRNLLPHYGNS